MDFSESVLLSVAVHYVGNKGNGGELVIAPKPLELTTKEREQLKAPFQSRFTLDKNLYSFAFA